MTMTFEQLLPRLVTAYDQGLLVPFLGAGMSQDSCPGWKDFIHDLERSADDARGSETLNTAGSTSESDSGRLIHRANAVIRLLTLKTPTALQASIRNSLYRANGKTESAAEVTASAPQTDALASLWWPLVVSSNYDDLFAQSYVRARQVEAKRALEVGSAASSEYVTTAGFPDDESLQVLGRSRRDCARVLTALSVTAPTVLWAIHGFLPRQTTPKFEHLESEMVVGHDEYRRVAHADPYYRRAFGELWRRRSLLFLGSSLSDPYLLDLFSEVQELYGTNPQPHYALVEDDKQLDEELLRTRFNIFVARYGQCGQLEDRLVELDKAIQAPRPRATAFSWHYAWNDSSAKSGGAPDLEISHSGLPTMLGDSEGLLLSAGFTGKAARTDPLFFSDGIRRVLEKVVPELSKQANDAWSEHEETGVFTLSSASATARRVAAIRPWKTVQSRDLNMLRKLLPAALNWAVRKNIQHLHVPVIGAGASRHFPAAVALSIIIREHKRWRESRGSTLRLTIHVLDATAVFELTSGRLNVPELLASDDLRFWVEFESSVGEVVTDESRFLHEPLIVSESMPLTALAKLLGLPNPERWEMRAEPLPQRDAAWVPVSDGTQLHYVGLSVGGTLKVRRRAD